MRKLLFTVLAVSILTGFAIFATPAVVAQEGDNTHPSAPASVTGSVSAGASAAATEVITTTSIVITGTAEADSTIIVEVSTDNGVTWTVDTAAGTTTDSSGNWSTTVTVAQGTITGIRFSAKDAAGNAGPATLFGYVLADSSSPTVSITSPAPGTITNAASIMISGTVTKDSWESYSDLTLVLQIGTGAVTVPIASDGTFNYSLALSEGPNTLVASVTDGVNAPTTVSVTVTRSTSYATTTPAPVTATIENIGAQVGQVISVGENGITSVTVQSAQAVVVNFEGVQPVKSISVTTSVTVETISVEAQQLTQNPTTAPEPTTAMPGVIVSHYLEITITPTAATSIKVENAAIEFKVPTSWLVTNNIAPESVTLLRYESGQWVELPTAATGADDATYSYYTATTAGFSTFAVVGKAAPADLALILGISMVIIMAIIVMIYVKFRRRGSGPAEWKPEAPAQPM